MLNRIELIGRVGKDPEVKYTNNGNAVANLSVATTEKWTDKNGEKQEKTEWHRVTAWGKLAELVGEYVHKGSLVFVDGKMTYREYEHEGAKRTSAEIQASTIRFLDSKRDGDSSQDRPQQKQGSKPAPRGKQQQSDADDVPF